MISPTSSRRGSSDRRRRQLLAEVRSRTPIDARERSSIARFVAEVDALDDPFSESAGPVHVTASGLVVGPRGVILHRHRLLGIWVAPGGHVDPGETPSDAAVRETTEETGLMVTHRDGESQLAHIDVHRGPRGHIHLDMLYLLEGGVADPAPPPEESQEVAWFSWPQALGIADPRMTGIIRSFAVVS